MNALRRLAVCAFCLGVGLAAAPGWGRPAELLPPDLRTLAASTNPQGNWPRLRTYAQAHAASPWSGWAYLLVGYQEFEGSHFPQAAQDLALAAKTGFPLVDYAVYYQASALSQSARYQEAAEALRDFSGRFPGSLLGGKALALRATALLDAGQARQVIDALAGESATRKQPALSLLLGQAYARANQPLQAAAAFQDVYYGFPNSPQATEAHDSLRPLRAQLGADYPLPGDDIQTARVEALFQAGRYDDALKEYGGLVAREPASLMGPRWRLGQARCLLRLRRSADALQELFAHFDSPDLEAQRLALLVQVYSQQDDAAALAQDLEKLATSYANSPAYADALSAAGGFYYRQFTWGEAARTYRRLREMFPQSEHLRDDEWRLGWCDYMLGDADTATVISAFLKHYPDSQRAPAALYWLARSQEEQGAVAEARPLYALLVHRFVHSYYTPKAAERLAALREKPVNPGENGDSSAPPLAAALIPVLAPPAIPPGLACLDAAPDEVTRRALVLEALGLKSLAEDFLQAAAAVADSPPELRLLLARIYRAQNNSPGALFSALKAAPASAQVDFSDLPEEVWDFLYPHAYRALIERNANLNHLDPYLVMGLIRQESAYSPRALSVSDARGLMQVLPETAAHSNRRSRTRVVAGRLYDPAYNLRAGCTYLAVLMKEFNNRPDLAMAAYHAGDSRVQDWLKKGSFRDPGMFLESIPISTTRTYVELVLRDAEIYRQLNTGSPRFARCAPAATAGAPAPAP